MKKFQDNKDNVLSEHGSVTISQVNQGIAGKETRNRTYWSFRKKVRQPRAQCESPKPPSNSATKKAGPSHAKKRSDANDKYTQLSLFPSPNK